MKFNEWVGNKVSVLVGTEKGGTEGADASLRASPLDERGNYRPGRLGGISTTFLDPGTWIRNVEFKGFDPDRTKIYHLEASRDNGAKWTMYEVYDKPVLEELDPLP
jgi:hypothetical protein